MWATTYIGDETLVTPQLVFECVPWNPAYGEILRAYRILVALVAYAHEHPDDQELAHLCEFTIEESDGERVLSYATLLSVMAAAKLRNLLLKRYITLNRGPWSRSHSWHDLEILVNELRTLRAHLEVTVQ